MEATWSIKLGTQADRKEAPNKALKQTFCTSESIGQRSQHLHFSSTKRKLKKTTDNLAEVFRKKNK